MWRNLFCSVPALRISLAPSSSGFFVGTCFFSSHRNLGFPKSPFPFISCWVFSFSSVSYTSFFSGSRIFDRNSKVCESLVWPNSIPVLGISPCFLLSRWPPSIPLRTYFRNANIPQCLLISFPAIRFFSCLPSSESLPLDQSKLTNAPDENLTFDSDRIYETIMLNSSANRNMEAALDLMGVELTTELVDDVIRRFRYEEKIAFRFFTWAGHQEGYTHQHQTYNDMMDILSSTKYKAKQFGIVCDILDHMKRKDKDSVPVEALLTMLRKYAEKHLTHLHKFAKKKKIRVKTQPEINAFNLLLDSLCKCSLAREAEAMFHRVKNKVIPDSNTYNILFFGWCRVRNPTKAMEVLEEMIQMGHTPENFTYNAAIDAFCSAGMVSEARELFEFMRTKGSTMSSPTAKTYCIMIVALAKADERDKCFRLLADMINSGCLPDVSTYQELIEGMCLAGKVEEAYIVLEEMGNKGYPPDILTYNCFLKVLCNLKKADVALRHCEKMIEAGCEPSVHTFNMLISMFYEMWEPDKAFDMWREMDKRVCARDVDTYCIMIDGLFGCQRLEDACCLLEEVMDKGIKLPYSKFDALLSQLSKIGNLRAIHRLSEHMRKFYNRAMARRFTISQKKKSMSLRRQ